MERLLHASSLPREKAFRTLDVERFPAEVRLHLERLRTGAFLEHAINVVAVRQPDVGKSHALSVLGHDLVLRGYRVLWSPTSLLMHATLTRRQARSAAVGGTGEITSNPLPDPG